MKPNPNIGDVQGLLERIRQRDAQALAELYDQQAGLLFAIVLRIINNNTEAEDVLQEVFVQIWEKAANHDPALGSGLGWIVTLARHRAIDRVRSLGRKAQLIERAAQEGFIPGLEQPDAGPTGGDTLASQEQATQIRKALTTLPAEQRRAIEMAFFAGLTQSEIAGALNQPLGTIKARIRRGMLQLRDILKGSIGGAGRRIVTAEEQQELAALAALGALDGADAAQWKMVSATSAEAQREAEGFTNVAALLALALPPQQPGPALKAKILARIDTVRRPKPDFSFLLAADQSQWKALPIPGVRLKELVVNHDQGYAMLLLEVAPGASYLSHHHTEAEDIYVLKGDCYIENVHLGPGDFHHAEASTQHEITHTDGGCTLLVVAGLQDYLKH